VLAASFGCWRLAQGPIELARLTPWVEEALNRSAGGLRIAISGVRFGIDGDTRQLDLWLDGVRLSRPDGEPVAAFPAASASFSLRALLRGALAPTRLVVERPVLRLIREADGAVRLRFGDRETDAPSFGLDLVEQAAGPANAAAPLGLLRHVTVRDATFVLDDRRAGRRWQADHIDASAARDPRGLFGDLSLAVPIGARPPELHAGWRYSPADRRLDLVVEAGAVTPSALATLAPELAPLGAVDIPVSGTLTTRLDLAGLTTEGVRIDLGFGRGSLKSGLLPEGVLTVQQGELHAVYAPETAELRLVRLGLDLGDGAALTVKGNLDAVTPALIADGDPSGRLPGELRVSLTDVPVAKFESLWPPGLSPGGRRWVLANISGGLLQEAAVRFGVELDPAARSAEIVSARGSLRYRDLTINYLTGLPPVRGVDGEARFAGKTLTFAPSGGAVKSVHVTGGSLQITELGAPVEWLAIDLGLAGPLRDFLETLDAKPLRYAHEVGLDPARVDGRAEARLHFKLPLLHDLKIAQVEYGAKARLTGVAIPEIALGRSIADGDLALDITRSGLRLKGDARFDGTPAKIDASLSFKLKSIPRARYQVALTLDAEARRRLGLDFAADRLVGPVGVDLVYKALDGARAEADLGLDLRQAGLSVREAGWRKPPGAPATASLALDLDHDAVTRLRRVEAKAAGLDARLALSLDRKRIERIDIDRLAIGASDLAGTVARLRDGGWRAELHGSRLDLASWLDGRDRNGAGEETPLSLDLRLGRLVVGPGRELRDVAARLVRDGVYWQAASADARFPDGRSLTLRFGTEVGRHNLDFRSDDLGATLRLLDVTDNIVGGRVAVTGQSSDKAGRRILRGRIEGADYHLVRAPTAAQLLSLASLPAVASMLAGDGIPFSTLRGEFAYSGGRLLVEQLLAYGGAIGATANGEIDIDRDRLDLQGTIVPAYTLNSILGNIPVIGSLLLGGEGQGLFAANYRLTGSSADPKISVNPLSALAPGFLRRLFQPNFGMPPRVQESLGRE
jgi:hypothetical protein